MKLHIIVLGSFALCCNAARPQSAISQPAASTVPMSGQFSQSLSALDTVMLQEMSKWSSPGASLSVTVDGRLVFARGYGFADDALEPVQPDSLFRVASDSKPFTATAILKLIEDGKLQLTSTPFTSILKDLAPPSGQTVDPRLSAITIQELLKHTAGWDDTIAGVPDPVFAYVDSAAQSFGATPPATPELLIRYMLGQPLQHDPGTTYAYSNFGYVILGEIIQRVSGQSYESYVQEKVQAPAGIKRMQLAKTQLSQKLSSEVQYYDYPGAPLGSSVIPPLGEAVSEPYGGFSLELIGANGGWVASPMDLLRFADTMNGQLKPAILVSPPSGFVGYVPPVGDGWGWNFYGSLPGTNTLMHIDTGYQVSGRISWSALFNTRSGSNVEEPESEADNNLLQAIQSITAWPTYDLFPIYAGSVSSCSFSLSAMQQQLSNAAAVGSISVTDKNFCAWTAVSNDSWISVTAGAANSDSGNFTFSVTANPNVVSRVGTIAVAGQSFTIVQAGAATSSGYSLQFVPSTPCRVADTRGVAGAFGAPEMGAGASREFDVPQSGCGIPASAVAYSLNVTVVPDTILQYLTMWPSGTAQPNVSTLNSYDGRIKANAAVVPAGSNGGVNVFTSDASNVILDINGYFVLSTTAGALAFYPLTPCRVADTRSGVGSLGGPFITGQTSRSFPVRSSACNIPASAQAYSLNLTTLPHSKLGYLTTWPTGQAQPNVSTLNAPTGAVTANAAIVPAGSNGDISLFVSDNADVILDVNGYFAPPGPGGLSLYPVTPCRVLDTRGGLGVFNGVLQTAVETSPCALPAAAQGYVLNATVVPPGPLNYITLWPDGESQPNVSTLNANDAAITSNMAIVPTKNGKIDAFSSDPAQLILDISSYFAP